jgi:hypothetical protein
MAYYATELTACFVHVPDANHLRATLTRELHYFAIVGHFGADTVYYAMSVNCFWPAMREDIIQQVAACMVCQNSYVTTHPTSELDPLLVPGKSSEVIALDWMGSFPKNKHGNDSALSLVDKFSKWVVCTPCANTMNTEDLSELLGCKIFRYSGIRGWLPLPIVGHRVGRLTASQSLTL